MSNINDFVSKNKTFKGKEGIIPSDITGVTGDRVNAEGRLRYNNTTKIGDKELILNTEIKNHQYINKLFQKLNLYNLIFLESSFCSHQVF